MADEKPPFVGPFAVFEYPSSDRCDVVDDMGEYLVTDWSKESADWLCAELNRPHSPTLTAIDRGVISASRAIAARRAGSHPDLIRDLLSIIDRTSPSGGGE